MSWERVDKFLNQMELKQEEILQRATEIIETNQRLSIRWHALKQWLGIMRGLFSPLSEDYTLNVLDTVLEKMVELEEDI